MADTESEGIVPPPMEEHLLIVIRELKTKLADCRASRDSIRDSLMKENQKLKTKIAAINRFLHGPRRKPFVEKCSEVLL